MNIQVQICGIVVVVLLLIMSINRKTIWLRTKRAFLRSLLSTLIMLVFDVLSIVTIVNAGGEYGLFTRTICKIYLISLVWMAYSMNQYTTIDIGIKNSYIAIFRNLFRLFLIISNIMIANQPQIPLEYPHLCKTLPTPRRGPRGFRALRRVCSQDSRSFRRGIIPKAVRIPSAGRPSSRRRSSSRAICHDARKAI